MFSNQLKCLLFCLVIPILKVNIHILVGFTSILTFKEVSSTVSEFIFTFTDETAKLRIVL